jgi:hypothetical protein
MSTEEKPKRKGDFGLYWMEYGGTSALLRSGYFRLSFVLAAASFGIWSKEDWWESVISVVPSLAGFSLAAYAMLIAFANDKFLKIITTPVKLEGDDASKSRPSVYLSTGAAFVHFILVQTAALLAALFCKASYLPVWHPLQNALATIGISLNGFVWATRAVWFIGYLTFIYGILCGLAATMRIYRMSRWYAVMMQAEDEQPPKAS